MVYNFIDHPLVKTLFKKHLHAVGVEISSAHVVDDDFRGLPLSASRTIIPCLNNLKALVAGKIYHYQHSCEQIG